MKILYKILLLVAIIFLGLFLTYLDYGDRNDLVTRLIPEDERNVFHGHQDFDEKKNAWEKQFINPKYKFPRKETATAKMYYNNWYISRFTSIQLSYKAMTAIVAFLNNSENFSWGETTWNKGEAEYIVRFFDLNNYEIGKIWFCIDCCGMTYSILT